MTGRKKQLSKPVPLTLSGQELPFVSSALHLGHHLCEDGTMSHDCDVKRAEFISRMVEIRQTFSFASPVEILAATNLYCSDYYGSLSGWDLEGEKAEAFFNSWTTNVKLAWNVPRGTRKYLVQQVLAPGLTSAKVEILSRFVTFFRSLREAPSHEVRTAAFLTARDLRTVTGRNVSLVARLSGEDP